MLNRQLLFDKRKYSPLKKKQRLTLFIADQENRTKDATLDLILKCLSYDFAGTSVDEAGDDTGMTQVSDNYPR